MKLILDYIYEHEAAHPERLYLTQPLEGGQVSTYSWAEVVGQARRMATHLQGLGFEPGARIGLLSKNCAHFFMAELAIWMAGYTTVSIFPTEGAETINYVLTHADARLLVIGKLDIWEQQCSGVPADLPRITLPLAPAAARAMTTPLPAAATATTVVTADTQDWQTIITRSAPMAGRPARQPDDLAMLIYTSGSTGQPKGVMHSFSGVTRAAEEFVRAIEIQPEDRFISYLPLAHVTERAVIQCSSMVVGNFVFFSESLATFLLDLQRARPTLFVSVPRLWTKFQHGVFQKMPPGRLDFLLRLPLIGKLVGHKVLAGLGLDQVRLAASGSAPISAELIKWYRRLGLNLLEGYGMSEDFALSHFSSLAYNAPGYVGVPYQGVEVRISETQEVLIKSPGQFVGYFKRPDLFAESFTADGFFHTGDMGERRADGLLKITGRIKELFKTGKGKYVAPAPIENRLNIHPMIELSMVSGVGQVAAYGLVMLSEELRPRLGEAALRAEIEHQLGHLLDTVNAGLSTYEQLQMLVVANQPWSIENGCLTPTMKIRRSRIEADVAGQLDGWYATPGKVLWA